MSLPPERVADYPRPPRLELAGAVIRIRFAGTEIASTDRALRVLETYHPPTYYLPPDAFAPGILVPNARRSFCEWKGTAHYFDIVVQGRSASGAAWTYPDPTNAFVALADHVAIYCAMMESCRVGDEDAIPQPGIFYGGWVTANLIGPFKGGPGTSHW